MSFSSQSFLFRSAALPLLCLLAACSSVRYSGESESPLPANAEVSVYFDKTQIKGEYRVLGRAEYHAPSNISAAEIRNVLRKSAREHGANGILILAMDKVPVYTARQDQIENRNSPSWNVEDNSHSALDYVKDSIMAPGSTRDPEKTVYHTLVKADFLQVNRHSR